MKLRKKLAMMTLTVSMLFILKLANGYHFQPCSTHDTKICTEVTVEFEDGSYITVTTLGAPKPKHRE